MGEETKKPEAVATTATPPATTTTTTTTTTQVAVPEAEKPVPVAAAAVATTTTTAKDVSAPVAEKPAVEADVPVAVAVAVAVDEEEKKITQQVSFKEETNVVGDLPESQKKALDDLKKLIHEACSNRQFSAPPSPPPAPAPAPKEEEEEEEVTPVAEEKEKEKEKAAEEVEEVKPSPAEAVTAAVTSAKETVTSATTSAATTVTSSASSAFAAVTSAFASVVKPKDNASKKTEDPKKPHVEAEETKPAVAAPKTEETKPAVAAPKIEDVPKDEVALKTQAAPKTEEVKKEVEEKTVEAIKETIIEEASPSTEVAAASTEAVAETPVEPIPVEPVEPEEVSIWGIPLLADERSDVILLKFLRARDFKVRDAFTMIRNTVRWRKEFGVDELLEEDLGNDYEKVLFTHGVDKEGRLVCYNVFGEFQNKELYQNTFSDAEKRTKFFKWLIQFLEKIIRDLDFSPKGINSIVLVNDLKNSPGYGKRDVSKIIDKFLVILQDNYPEFVAKQLCINTSWWYVAYYWIYLTVFTPRSKSKFVFASPSKTPDTLFKYIAPEHVPVQYGGHSKTDGSEFTTADPITEVTIKPNTKFPIEFAFSEASELKWELRVIGWDVSYGAEFSPAKEGGYTLNITKPKKVAPTDAPVITDTFKVTEAGKVVITIDNQSSKKKKLLYRSKVKSTA